MIKCKICGNINNNQIFIAREMMFGTREKFRYLKCSSCGCLQLIDVPKNIKEYYPKNYRSLQNIKTPNQNSMVLYIKRQKAKSCLNIKQNIIGVLVKTFNGCGFLDKISNLNLYFDDSILDVGTGVGRRLLSLANYGFTNLSGTDLFIEQDINYANGVSVYKKDISELEIQYDFIMLNHVFEHMPNPLLTFKKLYQLLKDGKYLMIRIPLVDSYVWEKYNTNWVQLDAPRHFFLHTRESIRLLAAKTGFRIERITYDSVASQFYGSEQYVRGITMWDESSFYVNPKKSIFTKKQIKKYGLLARKLNMEEKGDAACFYLKK